MLTLCSDSQCNSEDRNPVSGTQTPLTKTSRHRTGTGTQEHPRHPGVYLQPRHGHRKESQTQTTRSTAAKQPLRQHLHQKQCWRSGQEIEFLKKWKNDLKRGSLGKISNCSRHTKPNTPLPQWHTLRRHSRGEQSTANHRGWVSKREHVQIVIYHCFKLTERNSWAYSRLERSPKCYCEHAMGLGVSNVARRPTWM